MNEQKEKNRLIFITRRFPYFNTEAFIESEIIELSKEFSEILIFPSETGQICRPIPPNVKVIDDFSVLYQKKKLRALKTIFSYSYWKALIDHRKKIKSLKDCLEILRFCSNKYAYIKFFKEFDFFDKDLIYTYWFTESSLAFVELKTIINKDIKIVSRAHGFDLYEGLKVTTNFWPYRKKALIGIDRVFSISKTGKDYIENKYNIDGKVEVSKLGVYDQHKLSAISPANHIDIVSVGRVSPVKRVPLIASSVIALAQTLQDKRIKWTHFGDGPGLADIKSNLEYTKISNLEADFRGYVPNAEVYKFYESNSVSLFLNLSSSEGIPVSIMEAQSFGVPTVATNVGGTSEIVSDDTGLLLDANPSVNDVVDGIQRMLSRRFNPSDIKEVWKKNFDANVNYKDFVARLKNITNDKKNK